MSKTTYWIVSSLLWAFIAINGFYVVALPIQTWVSGDRLTATVMLALLAVIAAVVGPVLWRVLRRIR